MLGCSMEGRGRSDVLKVSAPQYCPGVPWKAGCPLALEVRCGKQVTYFHESRWDLAALMTYWGVVQNIKIPVENCP